jgi:hypothetical protein
MPMVKLDKNNLKGRALFLGERLDLRAFSVRALYWRRAFDRLQDGGPGRDGGEARYRSSRLLSLAT